MQYTFRSELYTNWLVQYKTWSWQYTVTDKMSFKLENIFSLLCFRKSTWLTTVILPGHICCIKLYTWKSRLDRTSDCIYSTQYILYSAAGIMQLLEWAGCNCIRLFNVQDMAGRYNCSFFRTAKVWFRLVHQWWVHSAWSIYPWKYKSWSEENMIWL